MDWQWTVSDEENIREATDDETPVDDPMDIDPKTDLKTDEGYEGSKMTQERSAPEHMTQIVAFLEVGTLELGIHIN
ncbi:hypothetical protein CTA1_1832 [Colletotrichum tanaceti]|uniref:Uncharacterized protein n=1 Tax=Colletotrichum tanaceti TaxID=1306861 RepID=A0A4U6X347_9PEZI|nr:hypothetical protein CTA1_1832 [Colletotrichum tanaceti]